MFRALIITFLCIPFFSIAQRSLDEENGFKQLKLGANYSEVKVYLEEAPVNSYPKMKLSYYKVKNPSILKVGREHLSEGTVGFFRDTLNSITFKISNTKKARKILELFESQFGKSKEIVKNNSYKWEGRNVVMNYNESSDMATIYILKKKPSENQDKSLSTQKD